MIFSLLSLMNYFGLILFAIILIYGDSLSFVETVLLNMISVLDFLVYVWLGAICMEIYLSVKYVEDLRIL